MKNAKKYIFGHTRCFASHTIAAFTLVELLVVISIIALLLSILMPALSRVREQGKRLVCANNQKQLSLAMNIYADQNSGRYPAIQRHKGVTNPTPGDILAWNPADLMKSSLNADNKTMLWRCPSDDGKGIYNNLKYPLYRGDPKYIRSYSANGYIVGALDSIPRVAVKSGSGTILFSENWTGTAAHRQESFLNDRIYDQRNRECDLAQLHDAKKKSRSNYSFVDGHVDFLTWRQVSPTGAPAVGMYLPYPDAR
ncbi:MAG: type II secretion system protein [Sedimentisphaerales bacterium]